MKKIYNYWKKSGVKFIKPVPIFGNYFSVITQQKSSAQHLRDIYNSFPDSRYCGVFKVAAASLLLRDPELIKNVLVKNAEHFEERSKLVSPRTDEIVGNFLVFSAGGNWKNRRRIVTPFFNSNIHLKSHYNVIDKHARQFVDYFKNTNTAVYEINLSDVVTRFCSDAISEICFGILSNSLKSPDNLIYANGRVFTNLRGANLFKIFLNAYMPTKLTEILGLKLIREDIATFFTSLVDQCISNKGQSKLIDLLVAKENTPNNLSHEEIVGEIVGLFFSGFESSSSLINFAIYELAVNPQIQRKLREEILNMKKNSVDGISYEEITNAEYLNMVVCETLRKWMGTDIERACTKNFEIPAVNKGECPLKIKERDSVVMPFFSIQRDEKYFENPDSFDPERFSAENKSKITSGTYLPFGLGPRSCFGARFGVLECKVLLTRLLADFVVVTTDKTPIPLEICRNSFFVSPQNSLYVGLKGE